MPSDNLSAITKSHILVNKFLNIGILGALHSLAKMHLAANDNREIRSLIETGIELSSQISRRIKYQEESKSG